MENNIQLNPFKIIGISVRTTNKKGKSMNDIGQLWNRFYSENILSKIPEKESDDIYSIYTEYKSDYTEDYTTIIGCKVKSLDSIPDGMIGKEFSGGEYIKHIVSGKMPEAVVNEWKKIWDKDKILKRKYTADYEFYGKKSQDPNNPEVEIFIAI